MMLENKKQIIFTSFYDKQGIVDEYVLFILNELKKVSNNLYIIVDESLSKTEQVKFSNLGEVLIQRNCEFSINAWKEALLTFGWDKLASYDALVLCDFSYFGPFSSFSDIFKDMESRNADFWGITEYYQSDVAHTGLVLPTFPQKTIHNYFMVYNNRILSSAEFRQHWMNLPIVETPQEAIKLHESIITKKLNDLGFKSDTYVKCENYSSYSQNSLLYLPLDMIANHNCPIILRECFCGDYARSLFFSTGQGTIDALNYIDINLDFDINLIYNNILRTLPHADTKNYLHQNYILPTKAYLQNTKPADEKVALVIHIYYDDLIEYCLNYACSMPSYCDIIVTVPNDDVKKTVSEKFSAILCNNLDIRVVENRGRDVSAKLVGCSDLIDVYDYICFVHAKKTPHIEPPSIGKDFSYRCFENLLHNNIFVENILQTFRNNNRLGMLSPPPPNHWQYYFTSGGEWRFNYSQTVSFLKKMNIEVPISEDKEPIAPMGSMFWVRASALKSLFRHNWTHDDFPPEPLEPDGTLLHVIERVYPYFVQSAGFVSGWVLADSYAEVEFTNINYMLREINSILVSKYRDYTFLNTRELLKLQFNQCIQKEESTLKDSNPASKKTVFYKILRKILPDKLKRLLKGTMKK